MSDHFQGKGALDHLIEARKKGKIAASEIHGTELPGHYSAMADAAKETAFVSLALLLSGLKGPLVLAFFAGWLLWKTGRSAILGWSRLERLHRLIEEERWEIEHHRPQEKEELRALYAAKGFSGRLLDEAVEVLMADDNRLLQVMLEEELGLPLEAYEHPLKQAAGAACGVLISAIFIGAAWAFAPSWAPFVTALLLIAISAACVAKREKNRPLPAVVWNVAVALLSLLALHFVLQLLATR